MGTQIYTEFPPSESQVVPDAGLGPTRSKPAPIRPKRELVRRTDREYSQRLRRGYQFAFLLMNVWLGGQFYLWVRHFETAGQSAFVSRPPGVRAGCPSQA